MTRPPPPPPPRAATPLECAIPAWLPHLAPHTFATELLPLPPDLAAYLAAGEGVWLGADSRAVPKPPRLDPYDDRCASWADSDEEKEGEEADGSAAGSGRGSPSSSSTPPPARPPPPSAAALAPSVDAAIARLGGRVLPKLNWSAPLDAAWMVPNNCIACENADEVFLLLQASDRIADDLDQLAKLASGGGGGGGAPTPTLALRAWKALRPGREVRAFVVGGRLAALCQRDVTQHVPGMADDRPALAAAVGRLFAEVVGPGFAAACAGGGGGGENEGTATSPPLLHYTFDAYVHASGKARLIDINPVGGATAPLLFEWGDLFPSDEEGGGGGEGEGEGEEKEDGEGGGGGDPPGPLTPTWPADEELFPATPGAPHIPFRIVDHAGAVAPGRTLYGAPHDMVAGEAVEELARRLRSGELGPLQ